MFALMRCCALWACVCAGLWGVGAAAHAQEAAAPSRGIANVRFERGADDVVRMSGDVQFALSGSVQDTLYKGVALYFVLQTDTLQRRWYWADKTVYQRKRHMRLVFQPLMRRWRVNFSAQPFARSGAAGVTINQTYESLDAALSAMRRISSWQVLDGLPAAADSYSVHVRFMLDTTQLQRPLQFGTAGQSDWSLDIRQSFDLPAADALQRAG